MTPHPPAKDPLSGHPGHLSVEQEHILSKFKSELQAEGWYNPEKHDDAILLRFLRARKFDLAKAKIMWIDTQKWRQQFHVEELYQTFDYKEKSQVNELYPRFYHKCDKDGRPIYIEQLGKLDLHKLYEITTPERQIQSLVVEYEKFQRDRLPICSEQSGHLIETSCTIMDLKGVGISQFWKAKNHVQEAANISQNNYPESMGKFYIINAPWAFASVWSLVKGWLDEATVAKIHVLSSDYKKVLLEQVPADSLPKFLGGTCQCAEGCSLSDAGPWQNLTKERENKRRQSVSQSSQKAQNTVSQEQKPQQQVGQLAQTPIQQQQQPQQQQIPAVVAAAAPPAPAPAPAQFESNSAPAFNQTPAASQVQTSSTQSSAPIAGMGGLNLGAPINGTGHA